MPSIFSFVSLVSSRDLLLWRHINTNTVIQPRRTAPSVPEISRSESLVDGNALHVVWYMHKHLDGHLIGGMGSTADTINGLVTTSQSVTSFSQLSNMIAPLHGSVDDKIDSAATRISPSPVSCTKSVPLGNMHLSELTTPASTWHWSAYPNRTIPSCGIHLTGAHGIPSQMGSPTGGSAHSRPLFPTASSPPLPVPYSSVGSPRYPNFPASVSAYVLSDRDSGHGYRGPGEKGQPSSPSATHEYPNLGSGGGCGASGVTVSSQSMSTLQFNEETGLTKGSTYSMQGDGRNSISYFLEIDNGRGGSFKVSVQQFVLIRMFPIAPMSMSLLCSSPADSFSRSVTFNVNKSRSRMRGNCKYLAVLS